MSKMTATTSFKKGFPSISLNSLCKRIFLNVLLLTWINDFHSDGNALPFVSAKHSSTRSTDNSPSLFSNEVHDYLMEYGYLPKSDIETGNLRTEEQFKEAIKNLQKFGNIPMTGIIDEKTKELIRRPRCGVPDTSNSGDFSADNYYHSRFKRFTIQGAKWSQTDLTWSLVNQTMTELDAGQVRRVLRDALNVWAKYSRLTFRELYSEHADIQVLFARGPHGDGYDFDGPGLVLAHAFYPGTGRGGDAHFDAEETWFLNNTYSADGTNLMGVAVHEFGHSLGLGHSSAEDAIMFPWYHGYEPDQELPEDDRLAIQQLYGTKEKQWGPYRPNRPMYTTSTTATTTTTTTTTQKPIYRFYSDNDPRRQQPQHPTYPRNNNPYYPQNNPPRSPHYPENDPRYPQYPKADPRYPSNNNPRYDPHYPYEPPKTPNYYPPQYPRYPQKTPITPTTITTTTHYPRFNRTTEYPRRHYPLHPKEPKTESPHYYPTKHRPHHTHPTRKGSIGTTSTTHRSRHRDHHRPAEKPKKTKPDTCNTEYDAISMIRGQLFIFKGRYVWRIGDTGLYDGYPHETTRLWGQLPADFTHVDAVYENRAGKIIFFIGNMYYSFDSNNLEPGFPKRLTNLGLPAKLNKIDAAMIWGYNNRTYLYSDTLYWRLDEEVGKVELDYPRDMSIWNGIGYHIDAAFVYQNGKTYFFKGKGYWEFNDYNMKVAHKHPKSSASKWMGCLKILTNEIDGTYEGGRKEPLISDPTISASCPSKRHKFKDSLNTFIILALLLKFYFSF